MTISSLRIHITGASGSGTSTLGAALALQLNATHLDADNYYWLPTASPFTTKRETTDRIARLTTDIASSTHVVLSGSIVGWDATLEHSFDLIVFLYANTAVRVARLRVREQARLGHVDEAFLTWAAQYDDYPPEGRSLAKHRAWLATQRCTILELSGAVPVHALVADVVDAIRAQQQKERSHDTAL